MIEQIIALLKIDNFYGVSENIDIAKGKYLLSDSIVTNYKQGKRELLLKAKYNGRKESN
jgi:hypothetical protein